tara:strand:+ start:1296 stop:3512 length:2217 start_codon:yes stop_codon:yes gene_type:complete
MQTEPDEQATWLEARDLFLDLADLGREERERRLDELHRARPAVEAWVRRLLDQDPGDEADRVEDVDILPGEVFGPYTLVRRIAVGGMGEVDLARRTDGEFQRDVAIKRLRSGHPAESLVQRFQRERETLADLDHESIVRLIDAGTSDTGQPYLVLDYVDGRHVDDYCREEDLGIRERLQLFAQIVDAVRYAHARGVVHRDLKPGNILVRSDGKPRLLDFGIAQRDATETDDARLTSTGQRLFTPLFASPEQIRGEPADERSDVFSLGVILYQMLAETGPWREDGTLHDIEQRVLDVDPEPPSRRRTGTQRRAVAGDLDTIVATCMAKRASDRYESATALSEDLERHLSGFPILARRTGIVGRMVRRGRRNPWQAAALLAIVVGLGAGAWALRSDRAVEDREAELKATRERALRSERVVDDRESELVTTLVGTLNRAREMASDERYEGALTEMLTILEQLADLPENRSFRVEVIAEIATVLTRSFELEEALIWADRGLEELPDSGVEDARIRARLLNTRLAIHMQLGNDVEHVRDLTDAHDHAREHLPPGDALRLEAIQAWALSPMMGRTLGERLTLMQLGTEEARGRNLEHDGQLSGFLTLEAQLLFEAGQFSEALERIDDALEIDRWNFGEGHGDVALGRNLRGQCLYGLARYDEAHDEFQAAFTTFEAMGHEMMSAKALAHLGESRIHLGKYRTAIEALEQSRVRFEQLLGADHPNLGVVDDMLKRARAAGASDSD